MPPPDSLGYFEGVLTGSVTMTTQSSITTNQPVTKFNPNANPNPTTKQHAIVSIQLNIVTCPTYPEKFTRDSVCAPFLLLSVVSVTLS